MLAAPKYLISSCKFEPAEGEAHPDPAAEFCGGPRFRPDEWEGRAAVQSQRIKHRVYILCNRVSRSGGQCAVVVASGNNGLVLIMEVVLAVAKVYGWPDAFVQKTALIDVTLSILQSQGIKGDGCTSSLIR